MEVECKKFDGARASLKLEQMSKYSRDLASKSDSKVGNLHVEYV